MRLSTTEDWNYKNFKTTHHEIEKYRRENEWVEVVNRIVPDGNLSYIELGCAPGFCSAVVAEKKMWEISGVDFSNSESIFTRTLSLIDKKVTYYQGDIFEFNQRLKFEIVSSYGLVEHFSEFELQKILSIHDKFLKKSGYLIIEVPNFNGLQYLWHYLIDKPNLQIHNAKIMNPKALASFYEALGYKILFCDYVGILQVWGVSSFEKSPLLKFLFKSLGFTINKFSRLLKAVDFKIEGKNFSPALLLVAKKN
jgi:2-polyprenyl-3-methyl-5-hydroxy-6-metoxy-1,4-benzoquinol methylase